MAEESTIEIRPYRPADRDRVLSVAPRLTEWVAATGAANKPARGLYQALGHLEEDVRLTKALPR